MTNFAVFNNQPNPLYTFLTNTYTNPGVGSSTAQAAAQSGVAFTLTTTSISVPASQNLLIQITNPSGSGRTVYISHLVGGTSASATLTVLSGGTIAAAGSTTPVPVNRNLGSATTSVVTTRQNTGTLTGTPVTIYSNFLTAGVYGLSFGGSLIVPQNQTFTISLGVGALTGSINFAWWELVTS
ncbi:hypothetical protein [Paenibacillus sp. 481]|uniref:hypothetical protein n=1 Tax=Paenibacillus sp. 481 TaxID=2835869 RepID=UPI001E648835|nr:hypothetical protein [Paenibacillus sp. 481]UHA75563.1 hypothetical protein KIK04_11550 [Paenibacillus sp. 481]